MGRFLVSFLATLLFPITASSLAAKLNSINRQGEGHTLAVIRGRAVCLDAAGREVESLFGCNETGRRFGFASKDGRLYKFLPTDTMTPVFTDARVRQRELQVTARLHAGDQLEIIKVQSVKEGKLYDIYYYCDVCGITAYTPGLCPCCRNELEFRETPQSLPIADLRLWIDENQELSQSAIANRQSAIPKGGDGCKMMTT